MHPIRALVAAFVLAVTLVPMAAPAQASDHVQTVSVYHQAVTPIEVAGTGVGTVRTFFIPIAVNGKAANEQYLAGTLTTLAMNVKDGQELRASNLTFVFGDEANQLIIGGVSLYPPAGATLAPGQRTTRPVIGGSGIYDGARGQVVSTNLGERGWTHVFKIRTGAR